MSEVFAIAACFSLSDLNMYCTLEELICGTEFENCRK